MQFDNYGSTSELVGQINNAQNMVEDWCKEKGWWNDGRTFGDDIALIHSELSEALEAFRERGFESWVLDKGEEELPKPEGVASELADVLVRLLHCCAENNIDLGTAFLEKMEYNYTRAFRHGGKAL